MTITLAGCSALFGDEIEKRASPARVDDETLADTGFEHVRTEESSLEQTIEVGGEERNINLTNWISEYAKLPTGDDQNAASFYVFTTPTISVAGRSANPFDRMSEKRFIDAVLARTGRGETDDLEEKETHDVTTLGETIEVTEYETIQDVAGHEVRVRLYFGNLTNDGDLLALLGAHPELLDERDGILSLAAGVDHPTDP